MGCFTLLFSVVLAILPEQKPLAQWLLQKFQNIMGMVFAWCTLWSLSMYVRQTHWFGKLLRAAAQWS